MSELNFLSYQSFIKVSRFSCRITADGKTRTTKKKFMGIIIPAKIPKALIGIRGLKALAKKATDVVLEVTAIALEALLKVYAILFFLSSPKTLGAIILLYLQASMKTNMSSAAMPRTMKTTKLCKLLKKVTLKTPSEIMTVNGKLKSIKNIPIMLKNTDLR